MTKSRYDGIADWYDAYNASAAENHGVELTALLEPGDGLCLDLGCGTGQYVDALRTTGRTVVGLDCSADQLRRAASRVSTLVRAEAAALPFADDVFPTVVLMWVSTDVDNFSAVLQETARVLRPGGLVVFYGVHPCFNGPCVEPRDDGGRIVHPTSCRGLARRFAVVVIGRHPSTYRHAARAPGGTVQRVPRCRPRHRSGHRAARGRGAVHPRDTSSNQIAPGPYPYPADSGGVADRRVSARSAGRRTG
ncbi:MAG: hypothetical protein QOE03_3510 [Micromonosporaceae bacterium]|nr:hypothetical protein [Micromonosporaceae bacterium]